MYNRVCRHDPELQRHPSISRNVLERSWTGQRCRDCWILQPLSGTPVCECSSDPYTNWVRLHLVRTTRTRSRKQLTLSTLLRWAAAGPEMNEPNQTSRFKNPALLELWTLTNNMSQLQAVPGSFNDTLSATYATIDKAVLGIDSNLMFVNVQDAKSTKDVSGSSYSLETAAAVMKDARIPRPSSVRTTSR